MLISVEGNEATGKTTFAYTAPLPIVGFSFDMGADRAIYGAQFPKWFKDKKVEIVNWDKGTKPKPHDWSKNDITIFELPQPIQMDPERLVGLNDLWGYFVFHCSRALDDTTVNTVVVDTMTLARRIKADAYLEELQMNSKGQPRKQLIQIEWGHPNDSIRNLFTAAQNLRKNFIAVHHLTDERKDMVGSDGKINQGVPTGKRIVEGHSPYRYVDMSLRFEVKDGEVEATISKSGYNLSLSGTKITDPNWDGLMNMVEMSIGDRIKFDRRNGNA
jgi:hypothetical protein